MATKDKMAAFAERLDFLRDCCLKHPQQFSSPVAEVIAWESGCDCWPKSCGSWCDGWECALVRLESGRYGVLTAWEDTTGHGCRCDSSLTEYDTREDAVSLGLTANERAKLGLMPDANSLGILWDALDESGGSYLMMKLFRKDGDKRPFRLIVLVTGEDEVRDMAAYVDSKTEDE